MTIPSKSSEKSQLAEVKETLAEYLGIETDDIGSDDSLSEDFHMRATDITDFLEILRSKGFDTTKLDLPTMVTFDDMVQALDIENQL